MQQPTPPYPESPPLAQPAARVRAWWLAPPLLLLALAVFWLARGRAPAEGSPEATFARDMAAHHAQAVEMALIIRDRSADEELRRFALDIVLTQQTQIGQMQGWLAAWGLPISGPQPPMNGHGEMMGLATQSQVNELRTLPEPEAKAAFLQLMIAHHQGGIAMAQAALSQTNRPEIVRLARAIVAGQQSELAYMQSLLKAAGS